MAPISLVIIIPTAAPIIPNITDIIRVSRVIILRTNLFSAPIALIVPISPIRSLTEITRVFIIIITATTATIKTRKLKTIASVLDIFAMTPAPASHPEAFASIPFSVNQLFKFLINRFSLTLSSSLTTM